MAKKAPRSLGRMERVSRWVTDQSGSTAALALAGIGPDRTTIEIWADPGIDRNIHRIEVESDAARFSLQIENVPSAENPKTGRLTPLSVVALLRKLGSPLAIGT